MKKLSFILIVFVCVSFVSCSSSSSSSLEKKRSKKIGAVLKDLEKKGWEIDDATNTLELALLENEEKKEKGYIQMRGVVSSCVSKNLCRQTAFNNVAIDYAGKASSFVRGRVTADNNINQGSKDGKEEFDKVYSAYERKVQKEIKGVLEESFSIIRKNPNGQTNEYQIFYLVSEEKASQARLKALKDALMETQIAQEYAKKISEFVNEGFDVEKPGTTEE